MSRMSNRVDALERAYRPTQAEAEAAIKRLAARVLRASRAWFEEQLIQRAGGRPVEFNLALGELIGQPNMWHPTAIAAEEELLCDDTPGGAAFDHETVRRYRLHAEGVDVGPFQGLIIAEPRVDSGNVTQEFVLQESARIAAECGITQVDVLEEAQIIAEGFQRFEASLGQ